MSILMEEVSFSYGEKEVLCSVNLRVENGESIGIVGISGGGKSTLLKLLSGLYQPQQGSITVEEATLPEEIRKHVAMVMQNPMLFPATIRENITCGHDITEADVLAACEAAQLSDWIATLPEGIDTFVGERGGKVSGGQAQRIAIARAIAKNAPVILLDEATSALDSGTGNAVIAALERLTEGKTVVNVSHRLETLKHCSRIFHLVGGKLNAQTF
jgi:ABC-type bacteriocin/lantibiotic exporter with double-glycine peptidase domain